MEFNSPRPEHIQLKHSIVLKNDNALNALQRNILDVMQNGLDQSESDTLIDGLLNEKTMPSPPLSPVLSNISLIPALSIKREELSKFKSTGKSIIVKPSWEAGLTSKKYRYATRTFLSQYKMFDSSNSKLASRAQTSVVRREYKRSRMSRSSRGSDVEPHTRSRRNIKRPIRPLDDNEVTDEGYSSATSRLVPSKRPSTPVRQIKKPSVNSPLASAGAVHKAPQYVPNLSWERLPDYCPPVDSLPADNIKCLKVEWKGSQMDLSDDPLRNRLHPAELILAQVLRLPCDLYLDSKRRFFLEKVHRLKSDLPFRRTDAQKACRIDVNKASRLYAAFEKVGWLKDTHFKQFV